jgi:hypothetical protein
MTQQSFQKPSSVVDKFCDNRSVSTNFASEFVGHPSLPFGTHDIEPDVQIDGRSPLRVRCYHRGCGHWVLRPTKYFRGEACPDHGIRCHHSAQNGRTYSYAEPQRNIIVASDLFGKRLLGHPFKYETDRFGYEKSEDALTWNVMRSLQEAGVLRQVAEWVTGLAIPEQPRLYLWGLRLDDNSLAPWDLLINARERFECGLPVDRPYTEPDLALHVPGRLLVLTEAKFTSPNTYYENGPRRTSKSVTKKELLGIYQDQNLKILDPAKARGSARVYNQLWRNMIFAEWMAALDGSETQAYLESLTRFGYEEESCTEFQGLIRRGSADRFVHRTWEAIDELWAARLAELAHLHQYLVTKTAGLVPAFDLG